MKLNILVVINTILIAVMSLFISKQIDISFQLTFILSLLAWLAVVFVSSVSDELREK